MTLIDGDKIVTAQLYDDEYEEFKEEKMSIIDYVNAYTDEGVTTADDVLDKIRAELHATAEMHEDGDYYLREEWIDEIINKYKAESQEVNTVLDKIRAEVTAISVIGQVDEHTMFTRAGQQVKQMVLEIIDKYKAESEEA